MIAALFVETNGCYFGLPEVDPWDIKRDARFYGGPYSVVAHPPCERWGKFATGSPLKKTYSPGDDGGCFEAALLAVEKFGGVLEHPAHSGAWANYTLARPNYLGGWLATRSGFTCHIEQGHYGHLARKATWLYAVVASPPKLIWGASPQRLPAKRLAERGYASARRCGAVGNMSTKQRQRTPLPFRDLLLSIANNAY